MQALAPATEEQASEMNIKDGELPEDMDAEEDDQDARHAGQEVEEMPDARGEDGDEEQVASKPVAGHTPKQWTGGAGRLRWNSMGICRYLFQPSKSYPCHIISVK
eukprot:scaffold156214_cov19-Prasinocladus_malaysianus.AAC.1